MSSLQETLNSLNRKLEQLKQGTGGEQPVDLPGKVQVTASTNLPPAPRTEETGNVKHVDMKDTDDPLPEALESDNEIADSEPEHSTKLNIFRSSQLALTDFTLEEEKERSPNILIPTAMPAGSDAESSLKSRRRKLFKGHSKLQLSTSKPSAAREEQSEEGQSEATKSKLEPSNKFKLRKLFRNSDRNEITIVEKPNPRKIIFRKGLVRGQRRKVGSAKKNDPLVKSLQKQIRSQSNRLFTKRKPFTGIAETSTTPATTTTTTSSSSSTTTEEVRDIEDI